MLRTKNEIMLTKNVWVDGQYTWQSKAFDGSSFIFFRHYNFDSHEPKRFTYKL